MTALPKDQAAPATQAGPAAPPAWLTILFRLAGGAALLALAALLGLSLAGYHPADPTWFNEAAGTPANHLGRLGSSTAALAYDLLGGLAWVAAGLAALMSWVVWGGRGRVPLPVLFTGGLWTLVAGASVLGLWDQSFTVHGVGILWGGKAGEAMSAALTPVLGAGGAWALSLAVLLAGASMLSWSAWPVLRTVVLPIFRPPALGEEDEAVEEDRRSRAPEAPAPEDEDLPDLPMDIPVEPPFDPEVDNRRYSPVIFTHEPPEEPVQAAPEKAPAEPEPGSRAPEPAPTEEPAGEAGEIPLHDETWPEDVSPELEDGPRILPRLDSPLPFPGGADAPRPAGERFVLPGLDLLKEPVRDGGGPDEELLRQNCRLLEEKLADYGVKGQVREVAPGPVVAMYEFKPAPGVKISKVAGLADDLAMNLKATSIRIVAPIPGKAVIGIEIPNKKREMVFLRELLASPAYRDSQAGLGVALGKNILGVPVVFDLARMPHLLIAGATGAGKSVFINTLILSILYKATPDEVRLLMVDPKRIELSTYNDIPHLLHPIITSPKEATAGLRWALLEMERRYDLLARLGVRNIDSFNQRLKEEGWEAQPAENGLGGENDDPSRPGRLSPLPKILIIIDELADLMMVSSKEVETLITRLAQMARAAGIHLVLATQRPSVDVITGLIKANFPARISFQVTSRVDSRTILDQQGAEHLLGMGDLLFMHPANNGVTRLHGAYVSDREIDRVVEHWKSQARPDYDESIVSDETGDDWGGNGNGGEEADERYQDAVRLVQETGQASISFVQRQLRVGYNRAARMIEQMEKEGIVGPSDGSRPREVLVRD